MTSATPLCRQQSPRAAAARAAGVAAAAAALLWLVTNIAPLEWQPAGARIVLDGAHYRAGGEELRWLESFSSLHFDAGEDAARAMVVTQVDAHLDAVFAEADARLPAFLDWYYSLRGEYSRIAMAALEQVNATPAGFVAERATAMLLPEEIWDTRLTALAHTTGERLAAHHAAVRDAWRSAVAGRLSEQRVPAPLVDAEAPVPTLMLDELIAEIAARETAVLGTRLSVSTAAAGIGAVATPMLARAAAVRSGRAAASRAAARGASRIGAAAASGAAVCAPGGVVAAACALLAGGGAWLATDWALLHLEEHMHRDELERSLSEALSMLREEVGRELTTVFDAAVTAHYADVEGEIRRTFVPAAAGRAARAGQGAVAAASLDQRGAVAGVSGALEE